MSKYEQKITRQDAESIYMALQGSLEGLLTNLEIMGSYRRGKTHCGDLDVYGECGSALSSNMNSVGDSIKHKLKDSPFFQVMSGGNKHLTLRCRTPRLAGVHTQIDLYIFHPMFKAPASMFLTGSGKHNMVLRSLAKSRGYKLSQYGLFDLKTGKRIDDNKETTIYRLLGVKYVKPEDRKDGTEIKQRPKQSIHTIISKSGEVYYIRNGRCSCKGFFFRGNCKHIKEIV